eukprot:6198805-Pleurochrysis_carterae.AAC.2
MTAVRVCGARRTGRRVSGSCTSAFGSAASARVPSRMSACCFGPIAMCQAAGAASKYMSPGSPIVKKRSTSCTSSGCCAHGARRWTSP